MRKKTNKSAALREIICKICNKKFKDRKSPSEVAKGITCSKKCRGEAIRRGLRKGEYRECVKCGKSFYVRRSQDRRGYVTKFCSRLCNRKDTSIPIGRYISYDGYWVISQGKNRQFKEHRLVMEKVLGRPLLFSEIVHHKNYNKLDNRPENLEVMTRAEHNREHGQFSAKNRSDIWTEEECKALMASKPISKFCKQYPHRTQAAAMQKRCRLKHGRTKCTSVRIAGSRSITMSRSRT